MKQRSGGFSLVEVLVATVLLAVGALAAVTVQRHSTMANQAANNRQVAGALARQLLEAVERVPFPDPATGGTFAGCLGDTGTSYVSPCAALSPANPLSPQGTNDATSGFFFRTWRVTRTASGNPNTPQVATVRVRVSWNQAGRAERVEIASVKGWTR